MPKHQAKPHKVKRPNKRDLTRYRAFAKAYLAVGQPTYFNAERSALAAGYKPGTAKSSSYMLLDKAGVQEEIISAVTELRPALPVPIHLGVENAGFIFPGIPDDVFKPV